MDILIDDIIFVILSHICDKNKLSFLSSSPRMKLLGYKIYFSDEISVIKIIGHRYYNQFTHIKTNFLTIFPSSMTHLTFGNYYEEPIGDHIPLGVTHLAFGRKFMQSVINCPRVGPNGTDLGTPAIPPSVTHLTFENRFIRNITDHIPTNITHLTLGYCFAKYIANCVPPSVTHLTFKQTFDQHILDNIPPNVTHLRLSKKYVYDVTFRKNIIIEYYEK